MHPQMLFIATLWIAALLTVTLIVVLVSRSTLTRILALDLLTLTLIAFLALHDDRTNSSYALDAALVLALLAFVGTLAAARYYSQGSLFQ